VEIKGRLLFRTIGWILRIEAWATVILGIVGSAILAWLVSTGLSLGPQGGLLSGGMGAFLIFLLGAGIVFWFALPLLIIAELVFILARIEGNSREVVELLRQHQAKTPLAEDPTVATVEGS